MLLPFHTPAEHYANPPSTWRAVQADDQHWDLTSASGTQIAVGFRSREEAEAQKVEGRWCRYYEQLGRWFAAEPIAGWAPTGCSCRPPRLPSSRPTGTPPAAGIWPR